MLTEIGLSNGKPTNRPLFSAFLMIDSPNTSRLCDRILVLENGTLLEIGSHYELLEKDGRYAGLFGLQVRGYK
ncbi:hypothetical protein [Spirosoma areae]